MLEWTKLLGTWLEIFTTKGMATLQRGLDTLPDLPQTSDNLPGRRQTSDNLPGRRQTSDNLQGNTFINI